MSARQLRCHNTPAMDCVPAVAVECNLTRLRTKPYIDVNCEKIHFLRDIIEAPIQKTKIVIILSRNYNCYAHKLENLKSSIFV